MGEEIMQLEKEVLTNLEKDGVIMLKGVIKSDICSEVISEFDIQKALDSDLHVDQLECENRIWRAENISPRIHEILNSNLVKNVSEIFKQKPQFAIVNHVWAGK